MSTRTELPLTGELTLNEISQAVPRALEVFNRHGLDSCCGGAKPLALVCEKHGLHLAQLLRELHALS